MSNPAPAFHTLNKNGFSLVELSIVLVILGLLTGGILTGQNLIKAATLRKLSVDVTEVQTAIMQYKQKYFALPGDHRTAYDFFDGSGGTSVCGANAISPPSNAADNVNCNGNGDGRVYGSTNSLNGEPIRLWSHLQLAGLLQGRVSQTYATYAYDGGTGANNKHFARTPLSGDNIYAFVSHNWGAIEYFGTRGESAMWLAKLSPSLLGPDQAVITPIDAWQLDKKTDDGLPSGGKIMAVKAASASSDCTQTISGNANQTWDASDEGDVKEYLLTDDNISCIMWFRFGF